MKLIHECVNCSIFSEFHYSRFNFKTVVSIRKTLKELKEVRKVYLRQAMRMIHSNFKYYELWNKRIKKLDDEVEFLVEFLEDYTN